MNTVFRDTLTLTGRMMKHITRSTDTIMTVTVMPLMFLLLFTYVFGGAMHTGGTAAYVTYLLPGILVIAVMSGISYATYRLFMDVQNGIFERFHAMPIAHSAVMWGHVITSVVGNLISVVIITGLALIMGFRSGAGIAPWLAVAGIIILFNIAMTWVAMLPGLLAKTADGVGVYAYPLIFLPFLSSAFTPTATMPGPVRWFANNQPVTSIVNTLHDLLGQQPVGHEAWIALAWIVGIGIVFYALTMNAYRRRMSGATK